MFSGSQTTRLAPPGTWICFGSPDPARGQKVFSGYRSDWGDRRLAVQIQFGSCWANSSGRSLQWNPRTLRKRSMLGLRR